MTEFFLNYGLFLAKTVTIVMALVVVAWFLMSLSSRRQGEKSDFIEIRKLNKK